MLKTDITAQNQEVILKHATSNVSIDFYDVQKMLAPVRDKLPEVFYYSLAAYYRFFIETAFPQYDKAIYLDCDVVLLNDIAKLYDTDVSSCLVGAVYEQNTDRSPEFTNYVEEIIGIPHNTYFNSGVMVMNLAEFRKDKVQEKFLWMLSEYHFDSLAPDQEYLNVICHGKVKYLPTGWNKHSFPEPPEGELNLCHFALSNKPWHYADTINGEYTRTHMMKEADKARQSVQSRTAWRIDGTLREFAKFPPVNLWFDYPAHTVDRTGILKDLTYEDSRPYHERATEKRRENAADRNEQNRIRFENAVNLCNAGEPPTTRQLAEYLELEVRTIRNWVKKYGYMINKETNLVEKAPEKTENEEASE